MVYAAVMIGQKIWSGQPYNFIEPFSALGYFTNYLYSYYYDHGMHAQMPFDVFWSLSIEGHFYILFPLTFILFGRNASRLAWVLTALCATCLALRSLVAWLHSETIQIWVF